MSCEIVPTILQSLPVGLVWIGLISGELLVDRLGLAVQVWETAATCSSCTFTTGCALVSAAAGSWFHNRPWERPRRAEQPASCRAPPSPPPQTFKLLPPGTFHLDSGAPWIEEANPLIISLHLHLPFLRAMLWLQQTHLEQRIYKDVWTTVKIVFFSFHFPPKRRNSSLKLCNTAFLKICPTDISGQQRCVMFRELLQCEMKSPIVCACIFIIQLGTVHPKWDQHSNGFNLRTGSMPFSPPG